MSDRGSHLVNQVISKFLAYVGTEHCLSIAYSKEENAIVERVNKETNRHITVMCFDRQIVDDYEKTIPIVYRILNSYHNTLTNIHLADLLFGNALNLDRSILVFSEEQKTLPLPLSASTSRMLVFQNRLTVTHRRLIQTVISLRQF